MTREEAIKKLESLKISLPAAKDEISEIIKLIETPWINVKEDLPCNHSELISPNESSEGLTVTEYVVAVIYGYKLLSRMYELDGKWQWETDEPTHWFAIPDPPKE